MEINQYSIKTKIRMQLIKKSLQIIGLLIVLFLYSGCKADELPCKSVPQGEFKLVE
jgi:hypothetical protein